MTRVRYGTRSRRGQKKRSKRKHGGTTSQSSAAAAAAASPASSVAPATVPSPLPPEETFIEELFQKTKFDEFYDLLNNHFQNENKLEQDQAKLELLDKAAIRLKENGPTDTTNLLNLLMALIKTLDPSSKLPILPLGKTVTLLPDVKIGKYLSEVEELGKTNPPIPKSVYIKKILDILSRAANRLTGYKPMSERLTSGLSSLSSFRSSKNGNVDASNRSYIPKMFRKTKKSEENIKKEEDLRQFILGLKTKISEKKKEAKKKREEANANLLTAGRSYGMEKLKFIETAKTLKEKAKILEEEAKILEEQVATLSPSIFTLPSWSKSKGGSRKRSRTVRIRSRKHSRR